MQRAFAYLPLALILFSATARAEPRAPLTTNHYRIHTDLEWPLANDLAGRMDAMFEEYSRRLVEFSLPAGDRLFDVHLFEKHDGYLKFTDNRFPNTAGVFMARKAVAAYLEGQGRDSLRRTLQHEAFHQFAFSAISRQLPLWINEGLAQIFEEGIYNGQRFAIGEVPPRRLRQLKSDIDHRKMFEFRSFMAMTEQQWTANLADKDRGASQYNQAWAMAHYLIFASDERGDFRFRSRLIDMLHLVHDGKSGEAAFTQAFSDNIKGFQQTFLEYAKILQPTPLATYIEHQDVLADMLVEFKARGKTFNEIGTFRTYVQRGQFQMEYSKGDIRWNTEANPHAYFCDLQGHDFRSDQLFLLPRQGAPLPDIICLPSSDLQLHTRFTQAGSKIEHEILVEPPGKNVQR